MSQRLISRSPDLQRLQNEGYEISITGGKLLIGHVPFRNAAGEVAYGILVSDLQLQAADTTAQPTDHVARFIGGIPHGSDGARLDRLVIDESPQQVAEGLTTTCTFSQKPLGGVPYADYYAKMMTYLGLVQAPALALDPETTAITHPVVRDEEEDSVFNYIDTASSRAGIGVVTEKLKVGKVAIVGLGGSGSYILDFLAKTPVAEIHLYDKDGFYQHNAFRSPSAPSIEDLERKLSKVEHFAQLYAGMRKGIFPHEGFIDETNVDELKEMSFVFIAADSGSAKKLISTKLVEFSVPFVDVGMGLWERDGRIGGNVRTTTGTPAKNDHLERRISSGGETDGDDVYAQNIQIAELNALNAALAVIKWKQLVGFYADDEHEHNSTYVVGGNTVIRDEQAA
jgi:hypothetical protein